jgi:UPF0755 protein
LFPDTYGVTRSESAKDIIAKMVRRYHQIVDPSWPARARQIGFSMHEVVIFASIVEKETGAAWERPLISSVFHNRLKKRIRLQSDPTVIYGIKNYSGNITKADLRRKTPYNTYRIAGLPAGPISNPGKEALHAALYPKKSPYIYFVSRNDGTHVFSKTLKEHNRAVYKYQKLRKHRVGKSWRDLARKNKKENTKE